jgi:hypothetical protein
MGKSAPLNGDERAFGRTNYRLETVAPPIITCNLPQGIPWVVGKPERKRRFSTGLDLAPPDTLNPYVPRNDPFCIPQMT